MRKTKKKEKIESFKLIKSLCAIGIILSGYLGYWFFEEEKPHFYVL